MAKKRAGKTLDIVTLSDNRHREELQWKAAAAFAARFEGRKPKPPTQFEPLPTQPELSADDRRVLATLVCKYGRDTVIAAAKALGRKTPGRRRRWWDRPVHPSKLNPIERAEWVEARAVDEYRGRRGARLLATTDLFALVVPREQQQQAGVFDKFVRRMKKDRIELRRLNKRVEELTEQFLRAAEMRARSRGP
jgi:hypothetical protein